MTKLKLFLGMAVLALCMTACPNPGGGGGDDEDERADKSDLFFDMEGAKAIAAAEGGGASLNMAADRAANTVDDVLFKVLEDNSVASIIDLSGYYSGYNIVPKVKFISVSPRQDRRDIYIYFEGGIGNWDSNGTWISLGSVFHVAPNGSAYTVVKEGFVQNPGIFDRQGNLYYAVSKDNSSVIYRYNPETGEQTQLTAAAPGASSVPIGVSSDGALLFTKGSSSSYLRVISIANPDMFSNICVGYFNSYALDPDRKVVYFSGSGIAPEGSSSSGSGLYKATVQSASSISFTTISENNSDFRSDNFSWWYNSSGQGFVENVSGEYKWTIKYRNPDGTVNAGKVMDVLYQACYSENIEFRFKGLTDAAALQSMTSSDLYDVFYSSSSFKTTIQTYCFRKGTNTAVTLPDNGYSLAIYSLSPEGSLWGFLGGQLAQLVDSSGKLDVIVPPAFTGKNIRYSSSVMLGSYLSPVMSGSYLYYSADTSTGAAASGFQNIYRFNLSTSGTTIENLLQYVPRNIERMEIYAFSVSPGYLYFGGTQGVSLVSGRVNLSGLAYTEIDFGKKIKALVSF
jgi:hypothetical protein